MSDVKMVDYMEEKLYSVKQVADHLQVSRQAVYDWIKDGRLQATKFGNRTRITAAAIATFAQPVKPGEVLEDEE